MSNGKHLLHKVPEPEQTCSSMSEFQYEVNFMCPACILPSEFRVAWVRKAISCSLQHEVGFRLSFWSASRALWGCGWCPFDAADDGNLTSHALEACKPKTEAEPSCAEVVRAVHAQRPSTRLASKRSQIGVRAHAGSNSPTLLVYFE